MVRGEDGRLGRLAFRAHFLQGFVGFEFFDVGDAVQHPPADFKKARAFAAPPPLAERGGRYAPAFR